MKAILSRLYYAILVLSRDFILSMLQTEKDPDSVIRTYADVKFKHLNFVGV